MKTYDTVYDSYFNARVDTPLHIIDQGSVLYLILMQILLYDQQNVLSYAAVTTPVMMKAYDLTNGTIVSVSVADEATFSVVMMKSYDQSCCVRDATLPI